jgi:predicted extracellular nuclease
MRRAVFFLLFVISAPATAATATDLFISEYVEGTSNRKAIEIYNGTAGPIDLDQYELAFVFNGTTTDLRVFLHGTIAPGDVHVIAHTDSGLNADEKSGGGWYNGDDSVLLKRNGVIIDALGQLGFDPGDEWGNGLTSSMDNTLRRKPSICAGDANATDAFFPANEWIGFATDTSNGLGSHTADCTVSPPAELHEIYEIQGEGSASPLAGKRIETRNNIVTAVGPRGFFIQTPSSRADASDATSNGVYVFTNTEPPVFAGDVLHVTGTVTEFFGLTELTDATWNAVNIPEPLPEPVVIAPGFTAFERLEGMLVRITNGVAASGTNEFGEVLVVAGSARPFREPGASWDGNPERLEIDTDALSDDPAVIIGGAAIGLVEGPLGFAFGYYEIWPRRLEFMNPPYPRGVRDPRGDEITVASQNLHDFNASDSERIAAASQHVRGILRAPDVIAVQEAFTLAALQALGDRIRADDATISYNAYLIEGNDGRGIDVGFLVRDTVQVDGVEAWAREDTWIPPGAAVPEKLHDRPPLVLRARTDGAAFTIIAVHLKSLIGIETEATRRKRHEQALRLSRYIQSLQVGDPSIRLVVIGDFNAFEFSDGIVDVLGQLTGAPDPSGALVPATDEVNPNLTNHVHRVPREDRYSYVFEGNAQVLDHALTSSALTRWVHDVRYARANADAAESMTPLSDHDAIVLYLGLSPAGKRRSVRH